MYTIIIFLFLLNWLVIFRHVKTWMLKNVLKHKSCLDPQIKNYDLIDFTLTYTKCGIE